MDFNTIFSIIFLFLVYILIIGTLLFISKVYKEIRRERIVYKNLLISNVIEMVLPIPFLIAAIILSVMRTIELFFN